MSDVTIVVKTFNNEYEAAVAEQLLQDGGVPAFALKDDAGGMEPHLQLTGGVRLVVSAGDVGRALQILQTQR